VWLIRSATTEDARAEATIDADCMLWVAGWVRVERSVSRSIAAGVRAGVAAELDQ